MNQVKIFTDTCKHVEHQINQWLTDTDNSISILDIRMTTNFDSDAPYKNISVLILYSQTKNNDN